MYKIVLALIVSFCAILLSATELPTENQVLDNGKVQAYIDCKQLSLRLKNVTASGSSKHCIASLFPTYFGYGTWNLFQLRKTKLIEDQEPPGFNRLVDFKTVKDADGKIRELTNTISNAHFECKRTFAMIPDEPIIRMNVEWTANSDVYVQHFDIHATFEKEFPNLVYIHDGKRLEYEAKRQNNIPFVSWLGRTDASGRNGAILIIDNAPYRGLSRGPSFKAGGISFPGNRYRLIKQGEKFTAILYIVPFNNADPVQIAENAEKRIFGPQGNPPHQWTNQAKPLSGQIIQRNDQTAIWRADIEQVPSDSELPKSTVDTWNMAGAANETIHEQLLVRPRQELNQLKITFSELKNQSGEVIPARNFTCRYPKAVPVYGMQGTAYSISGECPDLLDSLPHSSLNADKNYAYMISLRIPADTKPGLYHTTVTLSNAQYRESLPLQVKIHDFRLPDYPAFRADFLSGGDKYTTEANRLPRTAYDKDLRSLRISPGFSTTLLYDAEGNITGQNSIKAIRNAVLKEHDTAYRVFGAFRQRKFPKLEPLSPEMDAAMSQFAQVAEKNLKEAGVIDKLLWQHGDETHNEKRLREQIYYVKLTKKVAPALPVFTTINGWSPAIMELVENCDIIAFHSEIYFNCIKDRFDLSKKELWQYDNGYMVASFPSSMVRGIMWRAYRYGIKGYHHWGSHSWPKDFDLQKGNYDSSGVIYYPPIQNQKSPLRSARLVNFAAGVADYDYFMLLQQEIARLGNHPEAVAAQRQLDEIITSVVPDQWNWGGDYTRLSSGREKIAALIEKLMKIK